MSYTVIFVTGGGGNGIGVLMMTADAKMSWKR